MQEQALSRLTDHLMLCPPSMGPRTLAVANNWARIRIHSLCFKKKGQSNSNTCCEYTTKDQGVHGNLPITTMILRSKTNGHTLEPQIIIALPCFPGLVIYIYPITSLSYHHIGWLNPHIRLIIVTPKKKPKSVTVQLCVLHHF